MEVAKRAGAFALTAQDAVSLYLRASGAAKLPEQLTVVVPARRAAHAQFAALLASQTGVHAIAGDAAAHALAKKYGVTSTLAPAPASQSAAALTRFAAWSAVRAGHRAVVLPETAHDDASQSLSRVLGALPGAAAAAPGAEMLPPGALQFVRPLLEVGPDALGERARALGVALDAARAHGARRADALRSLRASSDALLRDAVLEASHWGYVVVRRSTLAAQYAAGATARLIALDALARAMTHVSGAAEPIMATAEHVARVAEAVLAIDARGVLVPMPKGRTAAGTVVRRATGPFARRLEQSDAHARRGRGRGRGRAVAVESPDDLMVLTREPDHETAGLRALRLGGNYGCMPLDGAVYWDNRYVMLAGPVEKLSDGKPVELRDETVLEAALRPTNEEEHGPAMEKAEMYARQLRRGDWERITSSTERVRSFQVPFECIRALPGVFEKKSGDLKPGVLAASPHLGLTARDDLYFTAVRLPRFRALPEDMCPGFTLDREKRAAGTQQCEGEA